MRRPGNPNIVKGAKSYNPAGRPKGVFNTHKYLENAIASVEKEKRINIYVHFVKRAIKNDHVLIALLKKLIPDKVHAEGNLINLKSIIYNIRSENILNAEEKKITNGHFDNQHTIPTEAETNLIPPESK